MALQKFSGAPSVLRHLDPSSPEARWGVRRITVEATETLADGEEPLAVPVVQAAATAVLRNPWIGAGTDSELVQSPQLIAARLSKLLADRLLAALGGADAVAAFGKGVIIGEAGEMEHGAAITHTPYFASSLRGFLDGSAVISFADARGAAGQPLTIPLCEKHSGTRRDFYQSVRVRVPDAPRRDELVLIAAAATGPRPFPRVGDRATDLPLDPATLNGAFA
ncbi:amino acid synthesis family protein [Microbacterium oryzae]|uniref:amino acid synthesis family protein n=1 Tax=Microbacterium oryzae TaxID=743009 RepID=UPI0025AF6B80|nr:amino acid synthesis family protein [Microbacterium oryzae]MDN3309764.1 amino acid synthesis family protein [Microbacterium oryzae]